MKNVTPKQTQQITELLQVAKPLSSQIYYQMDYIRVALANPDVSYDQFSDLIQEFQSNALALSVAFDRMQEFL